MPPQFSHSAAMMRLSRIFPSPAKSRYHNVGIARFPGSGDAVSQALSRPGGWITSGLDVIRRVIVTWPGVEKVSCREHCVSVLGRLNLRAGGLLCWQICRFENRTSTQLANQINQIQSCFVRKFRCCLRGRRIKGSILPSEYSTDGSFVRILICLAPAHATPE